jgi:hypothetical protein
LLALRLQQATESAAARPLETPGEYAGASVEGNGHPPTTQFVVKFANEIGFGVPFNADKAREEIELNGKRDENDTAYSNVEWIREWDGVKQGRERSVADFIEDG